MSEVEKKREPAHGGASPGKEQETPGPRRAPPRVKEIGGPAGPEPTRYGDWERKGIASDF